MCEETNIAFHHLIVECPALEMRRRELFLNQPPVTDDWRPRELPEFSFQDPINCWVTNRDCLMEQPSLELDVNYSIMDSDSN